MKISRLILIALLVSAYATVSVINIELAKPKDVSEVTVDMLDVMSRAFDESEGGEWICPPFPQEPEYFNPDNQCTGGDNGCMVLFFLNEVHVATWGWPHYSHSQVYRYDCIPEVIVNP